MDAELTDNKDSQPPEEPNEGCQTQSDHQDGETEARTITWTLTALDGRIGEKSYKRLRSEIEWSDIGDDGTMTFKSSDAEVMTTFAKQIKAILAEDEQHGIVREFAFTITSPR